MREWGCISETVTNLVTDTLHCKEWDTSKINSSPQQKMSKPKPLPTHIPFALARSLIFALPPEDHGKVDIYIDDTVAIGPDLPDIIPSCFLSISSFTPSQNLNPYLATKQPPLPS